jgi:hypothetical protein
VLPRPMHITTVNIIGYIMGKMFFLDLNVIAKSLIKSYFLTTFNLVSSTCMVRCTYMVSCLDKRQDFIVNDDCEYLPYLSDDEYPVDTFNILRNSEDCGENNVGTTLLSLSCKLNMHVLNGRCGIKG